ncbi:MAG: ACT domain-containing protein [Archaeoglobales archaeon]|nr:MAG: ACT domain-containing protein [Archaeoglobales archaeon]
MIEFVGESVEIHPERFAVVKLRTLPNVNYVAVVKGDFFEVVMPERELVKLEKFVECETGYRLITLDINVPLDVVGFISRVSSAMAGEKVPILILSLYSDKILVKDEHLERALNVLRKLGFKVRV